MSVLQKRQITLNDIRPLRKVVCPALPFTHLHREALVHQVKSIITGSVGTIGSETQSSFYKLVLLQTPAGYGKTTLLADFAQHTDFPCCWYFLDHTDSDRITFLNILLMSIRQRFPDFGSDLDTLLTGTAAEHANSPARVNYFEMIVNALIKAIETTIPERFAILLCNYHVINEFQEMNALVSYLIQRLPQQCVLIIESRIIPSFDFVHLLAEQMVYSIGSDQLRFTAQEIHKLAQLQGVGPFTDVEAEQIAHAFDGWIAGILLGTRLNNMWQFQQSLSIPAFADFPDPLQWPVTSQYLFSYVVNEVFKSHQETCIFLKEACILQEMTPATCAALFSIPFSEAAIHLHSLELKNLFVTHSGEGPDAVYTCTPVLRKLFYEQLRHEAPERFSYLHQRAAELLSTTHNYSQAIYHALESGVKGLAARLIIESAEQMMNQGHAETLARWIDTFPPSTTHLYPKLLLIRSDIYLRQGNHNSVLPLLDAADSAVQAMNSQASSLDTHQFQALQAEIAMTRGKLLFQQREYLQGQLICQQVLENLPADEVMLRAEAFMRLGLCHILYGDFNDGIAHIQKALQLWGRHTIRHQTADAHSALASAYSLLGNFTLAEHHITRALACWDQLQNIWGKIDNLVSLGNIILRQGAADKAEKIFQEALRLARGTIRFVRGQAYALSSLGGYYQSQRHYKRALEVTEEALALARQINDQFLVTSVVCDLAMIYLTMGDAATAMILISEVKVQTTSGKPIGYKHVIRDLIYGTIYLYQGQYEQAWPYLSESETTLGAIGLKQEHLQALLRLAAYHLALNQLPDALRRLEIAITIIPICEGYKQLALTEAHYLPILHQALKTLPELEQARTLLNLEPASQTVSTPSEQPAPSPAVTLTVQPHNLTILALGEPVVYRHQEPVTRWRMARAMELCFYLLDCACPMRKEAIIFALWSKIDEQTTRTFYSTIHYLRQALGGESVVVAKGGTYALRLNALYSNEIWYDVAAFEGFRAQAKHALEHGSDAEARTACLAMVELYRGDYVQPFSSDWCTTRRNMLHNAYLEARQQLAQIAWRAEQFDESIVHWQQMLAVDDWLEEAHYGLMRCYTRQGKRGLALRQYQRCKEIVMQEFGTTPRAPIQNLYQRLIGPL